MPGAPAPLPELRMPVADAALQSNPAWKYYYGPGAPFARACSRHVRMHRIAWAAHLLAPLNPRLAGDTMVDVGCGPGESTMLLADALGPFRRVLGIEISLDAANLFKAFSRTYERDATYVRATCTELPIREASVALLVSFEMVEHVANWPEFIAEAAKALVPGGVMMVSTPNTTALHTRLKLLQRRLRGWNPKPYNHYYDFYEEFIPDTALRSAAETAGLTVELLAHGGHVISAAPDSVLPLSRAAERLFETRSLLDEMAVTTFLILRNQG